MKRMILMVGLPSCGKSYSSLELVTPGGVRIEFDEYFYSQVGSDPHAYNWSRKKLVDARVWNFERITTAVDEGLSPIVVDSDNGAYPYTKSYVTYALEHGYSIEFAEPESPWWRAIRELLRDKSANREALIIWAQKLSTMSSTTHRVPVGTFLSRMQRWISDATLNDILSVPDTESVSPTS